MLVTSGSAGYLLLHEPLLANSMDTTEALTGKKIPTIGCSLQRSGPEAYFEFMTH